MRCERCWSEEEVRVELDHALCGLCRSGRPEDPLIFDSLFLPFASLKELLESYGAEDSPTALRRWAEQNQLSPGDAATRLLRDRGSVALFGQHAILQMRSSSRTTPYGYTSRNGALVPVPEEADTVKGFFRRYREGMSLRQIAEVANQQSIPTSRGGQWQASTIRYILRNPTYVGRVRRNNIVRDGGPPRLIDPELFKAVQTGLTRRAKRAGEATIACRTEGAEEGRATNTQGPHGGGR